MEVMVNASKIRNGHHNWTEKDEKALISCVDWVETTITNKETLLCLGGKWKVVSLRLFNESNLSVSDEACKSRFFKIKRRELHKVEDGKEVVSLLGTDFPQAEIKPPDLNSKLKNQPVVVNLQRKVHLLESEVKELKEQMKDAKGALKLNENLTKFFKTFGARTS
ncbi:hypothetical protein LCGC14_1099890 [marine sediment metagenome]|uniref:Myb-like domain-containing protein n=1 Tax=marine sediment metagenome TaxID=412755 RepID=A0A0F9MXN1_9ZZZZ